MVNMLFGEIAGLDAVSASAIGIVMTGKAEKEYGRSLMAALNIISVTSVRIIPSSNKFILYLPVSIVHCNDKCPFSNNLFT